MRNDSGQATQLPAGFWAEFKKDTNRIWSENCKKMRGALMGRKEDPYRKFLETTFSELSDNEAVNALELSWRLTDLFCAKMNVDECFPVVLTSERIDVISTLQLPQAFSEDFILLGFCTYVDEPEIAIVNVMPLPCWEELSARVESSMRLARII